MAVKTKLDNQDNDTSYVDIPLFATAEEAVKDIKVGNATVKVNVQTDDKEEDK